MSSSWGDVDNDGDLDLFVAKRRLFWSKTTSFFLNENGTFTEATSGDLVTDGGCSYGSNFGDFDNDGDLDLIVSNGYCNGNIVNFYTRMTGRTTSPATLKPLGTSTPCSYGAAWGTCEQRRLSRPWHCHLQNSGNSPLEGNQFS